jgi:hypothetical protein
MRYEVVRRTISFDKTKIRRKLHFEQHIFCVNYGLLVIYGKRLSEERYRLTEVLSKAITLRLSKTGRGTVRQAILIKDKTAAGTASGPGVEGDAGWM